jgi:hypothetical protein
MAVLCICDIKILFGLGCQCGGAAVELARERMSREGAAYKKQMQGHVPDPLDAGNLPNFRWVSISKMDGGYQVGDKIKSMKNRKRWQVLQIRPVRDELILHSFQTQKKQTKSLAKALRWGYSIYLPEDRIRTEHRRVS